MGLERVRDLVGLVELGIIQEANRLFLHPLGFALGVDFTDRTHPKLVMYVDNDPTGITFADVDAVKTSRVDARRDERQHRRIEEHGWLIQPPEVERGEPRPDDALPMHRLSWVGSAAQHAMFAESHLEAIVSSRGRGQHDAGLVTAARAKLRELRPLSLWDWLGPEELEGLPVDSIIHDPRSGDLYRRTDKVKRPWSGNGKPRRVATADLDGDYRLLSHPDLGR